ncbi:Lrp/AsnC family transcriptional regulator [Phenylobacterium sp.]|jgi:Lrp/AsnC family leucine-responsive transcriptional regulator|uniref:Lrp/AsnC family transcriptional regulator n=1 Tax=Phenylobacterium sp. TaxID=1871053 RepID=UPI0037C7ECF5
MDRVDLGLLAALEKNGRQSFATLAELSGMSKTSVWSRVQTLEETGVIRNYRAVIDPALIGLKLTAYVSIMIDFSKRDSFEKSVMSNPAVVECFTTAGEADYIMRIICRDVSQLDNILRYNISLMPGVQRSTTLMCLKSIKQDASLVDTCEKMDLLLPNR